MENENTESSRVRDARPALFVKQQDNLYVKFENVYKKRDRCVFYYIIPEDVGKRLKPYASVVQTFPLADPWLRKKEKTDSHILAHVNVECLDNRYPKLEIHT